MVFLEVCITGINDYISNSSRFKSSSHIFSGTSNFKCVCPPGSLPSRGSSTLYIKNEKNFENELNFTQPLTSTVCKRNTDNKESKKLKRIYKGTLHGGLVLAGLKQKIGTPNAIIGKVDDISESKLVNFEKMKQEHEEKPKHYGIHLSKLQSLENDRVQGRELDMDLDIISNIF